MTEISPAAGRIQSPSPTATALKRLRPRCAAPTLYRGLASFQPKCRVQEGRVTDE
jgi:uncharacterized protein (DUF983 family)